MNIRPLLFCVSSPRQAHDKRDIESYCTHRAIGVDRWVCTHQTLQKRSFQEPQNLSWVYFHEIAYGSTLLASTLPSSCSTMMDAGGIQ